MQAEIQELIDKRTRILDILERIALKLPTEPIAVPEKLEGFVSPENKNVACVVCQKCKDVCPVDAISVVNAFAISSYASEPSSEEKYEAVSRRKELQSVISALASNLQKQSDGSTISLPETLSFMGSMRIDPMRCIGCAKCIEICPNSAMRARLSFDLLAARPSLSSKIFPEVRRPSVSEDFEPLMIAFFCQWCTYGAADLAGTSRMQYPPNFRVVRVPCTGKVDPLYILKAFEIGVDAVIVSGCLPNQCHYVDGNFKAERRIKFTKGLLDAIGIGGDRLEQYWISASMAPQLVQMANEMRDRIKKLGPSPLRTLSTED